jgi:hypothetical protein
MERIQRYVYSEFGVRLAQGDVEAVLADEPEASMQGVLCDPPYGLRMADWDQDVPRRRAWAAVARVLEPGAWALVFGHPRTHHRLMERMERGGLEIRDVVLWMFGTGPVRARSSLRPAWHPVVLARRPGPIRLLDIDGCRTQGRVLRSDRRTSPRGRRTPWGTEGAVRAGARHHPRGRWPANLMLEHGPGCTEEACLPGCPVELLGGESGVPRFFWCPKAAGRELAGNPHPTKKPVRLTEELARLLRVGGERLGVPWSGSGSEVIGGVRAGWPEVIGIEREPRWLEVARRRLEEVEGRPW